MTRTRGWTAGLVVAAWMPVFAAWVIFTMAYGGLPVSDAIVRSIVTIGGAAVLGVAVSAVCAWFPWPDALRLRFYVTHFAVSGIYASLWIIGMYGFDVVVTRRPFWPTLIGSPVLGWQFIMGVWLYGVIAGVSYAVLAHRRAIASEHRALRAEANLAQARLDALRSRLHPHFLFNALHTVGALVRRDPADAESAVEKLGDMLRYTLRENGDASVSLAEEWEFTRRYIQFEELRYGERLHVTSAIDDDCMDCLAPTFALQTLVENAIQHSIATRAGGNVHIAARRTANAVCLQVRDDGGRSVDSSHRGSGYGLTALRQRLDAAYGGAATLSIDNHSNYFEASLTIPAHEA